MAALRTMTFLALTAFASAGLAQPAGGEGAWLLGSGAISCGKWVEDRNNKHLRA